MEGLEPVHNPFLQYTTLFFNTLFFNTRNQPHQGKRQRGGKGWGGGFNATHSATSLARTWYIPILHESGPSAECSIRSRISEARRGARPLPTNSPSLPTNEIRSPLCGGPTTMRHALWPRTTSSAICAHTVLYTRACVQQPKINAKGEAQQKMPLILSHAKGSEV